MIVDKIDYGLRCARVGEQLRIHKRLQPAYHRHDKVIKGDRREHGHRDGQKLPDLPRAVYVGGLVIRAGNIQNPRHVQNYHAADTAPYVFQYEHDPRIGRARSDAQPVDVFVDHAQRFERDIDYALRFVEHQFPHERDGDRARYRGQIKDHAEKGAAAEVLLRDHGGEGQAEQQIDGNTQHDDEGVQYGLRKAYHDQIALEQTEIDVETDGRYFPLQRHVVHKAVYDRDDERHHGKHRVSDKERRDESERRRPFARFQPAFHLFVMPALALERSR